MIGIFAFARVCLNFLASMSVALFAVAVAGLFGSPASAATERVVYSFCSQKHCADGEKALGGVIDVDGALYGVTYSGGAVACVHVPRTGCGALFSLDPSSGMETVLHSFCSRKDCADGMNPGRALIDVKGALYGAASFGGSTCALAAGCGVLFALDPATGKEKELYTFCSQENCTDGAVPEASLIDVKGILYGNTAGGGANFNNSNCGDYPGCGTVFSLDPATGAHTVLYSFCSKQNCADGWGPEAGLLNAKGTLYGTTYGGGVSAYCGNSWGCGAVFALDSRTGSEKVLYSFCGQANCSDGSAPGVGGLIAIKGKLYGVTSSGGANNQGVVFAIDIATGKETVLYSFCSQANCTDGAWPEGGLIDVKGTLYGTTKLGGAYCQTGCGTVFALDPNSGAETVLHSFGSGTDGGTPNATLLNVKGVLYGTTAAGGANNGGTVFALQP
ncbi:MAG TPA: choice-of-anchor tandem repeat GloVer-containing protein [Rhizomicrobium sp.]|nr:choice-of-anchor tandem repeat GloVer-containing protein [Rhizomicrobium sp.]